MTATTDTASATVFGSYAGVNDEVLTEVTVFDDSGDDYREVGFELKWGRSSHREFGIGGEADIRALARVLAHSLGTTLADEADEDGPACPVCGQEWPS